MIIFLVLMVYSLLPPCCWQTWWQDWLQMQSWMHLCQLCYKQTYKKRKKGVQFLILSNIIYIYMINFATILKCNLPTWKDHVNRYYHISKYISICNLYTLHFRRLFDWFNVWISYPFFRLDILHILFALGSIILHNIINENT